MRSDLYEKMKPFLGNEQELCRRMAGQMDLWEECVRLFPREEILKEAEDALREEAYGDCYKVVHRLKGNLANFGFDGTAEKAMKLLQSIKENDVVHINAGYEELKREYLQIIERIGEAE